MIFNIIIFSGVKLLQTQLQLKKATHAATVKKDSPSVGQKTKQSLAPVKDFKKAKKEADNADESKFSFTPSMVRNELNSFYFN